MNPRRFAPLVLLVGCGAPTGLAVEPQTLHFTPARPELTLRLVHAGSEPLPLAKIRLDHRDRDWTAFTLTNPTLPKVIDPGGEIVLHLRADVDHFADHDTHAHRSGAATLTLQAGGEPRRIALQFSDGVPPLTDRLLRLGLLAALVAGIVALARRVAWTTSVPAAIAVAIAPLGAGLCREITGSPPGPADLLQCAEGRGGTSLQLLPHVDGLGLFLAALLFSGLGRISGRGSLRLGLALAVLAAAFAGGSLDPQRLVAAQAGLRWGLWMQPFAAAALILAALAEVRAARVVAPITGLVAAVGLAALLTTLCLGGADPLVVGLPQAAAVAVGVGLWLAKVAVVAVLLLRGRIPANVVHAVIPLAIAQIVLSTAIASP